MVGLIFLVIYCILAAAILVVPLYRLIFPAKTRGMITLVLIAASVLIILSYTAKSFFTVFINLLPFLFMASILGVFISARRTSHIAFGKRIEKMLSIFLLVFILGYFGFAVFGKAWIGTPLAQLSDAKRADWIEYSTDFKNLRLVPPALAGALSKTKNTYSNYHVGEKDIYYDPQEMRLKWAAALEPDNIIIGFSRNSPGFISGYAGGTLNPSVDFFEEELTYTEERPLLSNIYTQILLSDPTHEYGDAFLVKNSSEYFWLVPLIRNYFGFAMTSDGVATVNAKTGATEIYAKDAVPEWLGKWRIYPENVALWRVSVYSIYKHGLINALFFKNDIDEIPQDTEPYLINIGDEVYWFISVEPAGGQEKRALSGYYLIGANGNNAGEAIFVDKKNMNFIGPTVASNYVQSKVSNYDGWKAVQPLLYTYNGKETWVVPVLYTGGETAGMKLVAVGFVDTNTEDVKIMIAEGGVAPGKPTNEDEIMVEYKKYRDDINDRLKKMDDLVEELRKSS